MAHKNSDTIEKHVSILHQQDIQDICRPLHELNITTFTHVKMTNTHSFSALSSTPLHFENYARKKHYNADIFADAKHCHLLNCLMWDKINAQGLAKEMLKDAYDFEFRHIFGIIQHKNVETNIYHFGTHLKDDAINQVYINNFDLLEKFIDHFNDRVSESPHLKAAYDIQFDLKKQKTVFDDKQNTLIITEPQKNTFLNKLASQKLSSTITERELTFIPYIMQGSTAKEMAMHFQLSKRTVEDYMTALKNKLQARNKTELVVKLLKLF